MTVEKAYRNSTAPLARLAFSRHTASACSDYASHIPLVRLVLLFVAAILAACGSAATPTPTPTLTPTLVSTATDVPTLQPSMTPEPSLMATATLIPVTVQQLSGEELPPPFDITLPPEWALWASRAMLVQDVDGAFSSIPVTAYNGPVTGGKGYIVVFWGFPNLISPLGGQTIEQVMWAEGLRLFRMAVVDQGCNPGTDLQSAFKVGGRTASGTRFAIVDCPESPDARGWFAGLRENDLNFMFFAYTEPTADIDSPEALQAINVATVEMQAILDTVSFHALLATPTSLP